MSGTVYSLKELVVIAPGRGGGGVRVRISTKFYTGTLRFEVQSLNLLFPVIHVSEDIIKIQSIENKHWTKKQI